MRLRPQPCALAQKRGHHWCLTTPQTTNICCDVGWCWHVSINRHESGNQPSYFDIRTVYLGYVFSIHSTDHDAKTCQGFDFKKSSWWESIIFQGRSTNWPLVCFKAMTWPWSSKRDQDNCRPWNWQNTMTLSLVLKNMDLALGSLPFNGSTVPGASLSKVKYVDTKNSMAN